ncbi:MAG: hypothetical protein K6G51_06050 [Sphaerochaetaceae bacterium]|nr:hypothetical protein [Sphaerochaetaceae bacterium]
MLFNRRLIAFSSRVHGFILMLYIFFVVLIIISSVFDVGHDILSIENYCLLILSWTIVLFGIWIQVFCLLNHIIMRDFPLSYFMHALLRVIICLVIAFMIEIGNILIVKGVSI